MRIEKKKIWKLSWMQVHRISGILIFVLACASFNAQPSLKLNYGYLHSTELDRVMQLYNTSRPWQLSPLVPITHGLGSSIGWNWRIQKSHEIHLLSELSYAGFFSKTSNDDKTISAGFHQVGFDMTIRIHPKAIYKSAYGAGPLGTRFFMIAGAGFNAFVSRSKINGSLVESPNQSTRTNLAWAPDVRFGFGFHVAQISRFIVTPEVAVSWIPEMELEDFTESINGHNVTAISNVFQNPFIFNVGLRITMIGSQKNWWDRPRQGDKT